MKIRLVSKKLKSLSLSRMARGLTMAEKYRVWRSRYTKPKRRNLFYGDMVNKTAQYKYFSDNDIPALVWTTNYTVAKSWCEAGQVVVCRTLTRASEGKGIVLAEESSQVVMAPVYTQYKKKKKEFRVHVFKDKVVHVLEKRKRKGFEGERETKVRNTANGYVFCSENVEEPEGLRELAIKASKVTKSDFKGVDIGWNEKKSELFVIEVNSAPGIEGSNIHRYVQTILSYEN